MAQVDEPPELLRVWGLFALALVAYRALSNLIAGVVRDAGIPVHLGYAADWELSAFGTTAAGAVQGGLGAELLWGVVHDAAFPVMIAVAVAVADSARDQLPRFMTAVVGFLAASLAVHLALPTLPPFMAAAVDAVPAVDHARGIHLGALVPGHTPLATMPSVPFGLAVLVTILGLRCLGRRALPLVGYSAAVALACLYRGEAYILSLVAGGLLAALAFALTWRRTIAPVRRRRLAGWLIAGVGIAAAVATPATGEPWTPDRGFAQRELRSRTPSAYRWIGIDAFATGDYALAAGAFERLPPELHDAGTLTLMARAHSKLGHVGLADRVFRAAERADPGDPRPFYWRFRAVYEAGQVSEEHVLGAAHALHENYGTDEARRLAAELERLVDRGR